MNERKLKNNKGITLISLIITIAVMFIVAGTTVYTSLDRFEINRLKKMYNDIELLSDKVANYYLKYNGLPIKEQYTYTTLNFEKNANDNGNYYIIDLEAMEGISLNYGKEGYNRTNESDDVYIINEKSHTIYYVKGIEVDGKTYHYIKKEGEILDTIPPTKPEIKVISGTLNSEGKYTSDVELEIIPGKDNWSGVKETICTITKNGIKMEDVVIGKQEQNYIYKITNNGTYVITAITKDSSGYSSNVAEMPPVTIKKCWINNGDGTLTNGSETVEIGKTTYTNAEVLEKLGLTEYTGTYKGDWQLIGLEGDKLKLVSVNNVASNVALGKTDENVYKTDEAGKPTTELKEEIVDLNGDEDLDLEKAMWSYDHAEETLERKVKETTGEIGEKGNARSITIEDINAISKITEEDKRTFNEQYGRTYRYFYYSGYIANQYLDYNEIDTEAEDTEAEGWSKRDCGYVYKYFISNDKTVIDSNNQSNVVKLQHTNYTYKFTEKGLFAEKTDAFASLTTGSYWLDSKSIDCGRMAAYFFVHYVNSGSIYYTHLFGSYGAAYSGSYGVRAVVSI